MLINRKGNVVADGFDFMTIAENRVLVQDGRHFGFVNFRGKVMVPLIYENAVAGFQGGVAPLLKGDKWGYVDRWGKVKIAFQFDSAGPFNGGKLAAAAIGARTGFIDRMGKFKFFLPYRYTPGFIYGDVAHFFTDDNRFGYVDESGKVIWGPGAENPFEERVSVWVEGEKRPSEWSEQDKAKSCIGIPDSIRKAVATFPPTAE